MTKYRFISDPGHGWLEVPKKEVKSLGVKPRLSARKRVCEEELYELHKMRSRTNNVKPHVFT